MAGLPAARAQRLGHLPAPLLVRGTPACFASAPPPDQCSSTPPPLMLPFLLLFQRHTLPSQHGPIPPAALYLTTTPLAPCPHRYTKYNPGDDTLRPITHATVGLSGKQPASESGWRGPVWGGTASILHPACGVIWREPFPCSSARMSAPGPGIYQARCPPLCLPYLRRRAQQGQRKHV